SSPDSAREVRIILPPGKYVPVFIKAETKQNAIPAEPPIRVLDDAPQAPLESRTIPLRSEEPRRHTLRHWIAASAGVLTLVLCVIFALIRRGSSESSVERFWAPVLR